MKRTAAGLWALALLCVTQPQLRADYIAATWIDDSIHFLDSNFNSTGSFLTGASEPTGNAYDGTYLYSGHAINATVFGYNLAGSIQFSWSDGRLFGLQAMSMVDSELAISSAGQGILFFDPLPFFFFLHQHHTLSAIFNDWPMASGCSSDVGNFYAACAELAAGLGVSCVFDLSSRTLYNNVKSRVRANFYLETGESACGGNPQCEPASSSRKSLYP